ncbi:MAG: type II toxin-antitoxin system RelE/ParE family toxin [Smithellaceae bacterium]
MSDKLFEIEEFETNGCSPFGTWFDRLDSVPAAKIVIALTRLKAGQHSNVKSVGSGVAEYKIDFGPGYRIYFGIDGDKLIILLFGGDKKTQRKDIERAKKYWQDYKDKKKKEIKHGSYKEI